MANKEDFREVRAPLDGSVNKNGKFKNLKQLPEEYGVCFSCGQSYLLSACRLKTAWEKGHATNICSFQKRKIPSGAIRRGRFTDGEHKLEHFASWWRRWNTGWFVHYQLERDEFLDQNIKFNCCCRKSRSPWRLTRVLLCLLFPCHRRWMLK